MQLDHVTTPFGRRSLSFAMLKDQLASAEIEDGARADKWKIYRGLCEARERFGVTDRALAILNALLSFYPKNELSADDAMIVFPSNAQLSLRAHGMAEQTIRRHIASLIQAGLLMRRDSANGKRFVRRNRQGTIDEAFGFSLAPLLGRAEEIERLAAEVEAERLHLQRLKERLTICRRDVAKLIATAVEEGAAGDWAAASAEYQAILARLPRKPDGETVTQTLDDMMFLRENILNQLEMQIKNRNKSGNAGQYERHIQNSNTDSKSEIEPCFEKQQGQLRHDGDPQWPGTDGPLGENEARPETSEQGQIVPETVPEKIGRAGFRTVSHVDAAPERKLLDSIAGLKPFPLGMVLSACPEIVNYGPGGNVSSWRDIMAAAVVVRSMLDVSPSAYEEACSILGPENAATVIACILERAGHINSAGGYLRDLTRRAERGEFSLGPMLMAQMKGQGATKVRAG
jgi:replication initiation protein RepC